MRAGVDVVYQGVSRRRLARRRRFPHSVERPSDWRLELRGGRHEAGPPREAGLHPPALLLLRAARAHPGRPPTQMHVLLGTGERGFRPPTSPPTTGACGRGSASSSPTRRPTTATRSTSAGSASSSRSATQRGTRSIISSSSPGSGGTRSRGSEPRGSTSPRSAAQAAATGPRRAGDFEKLGSGRAPARARGPGEHVAGILEPEPATRLRAAPRPVARRPLLRPRGRSVLGRERASSTSGAARRPRGVRFVAFWARSGRGEGRRSSGSSGRRLRPPREHPDLHVYHYARTR